MLPELSPALTRRIESRLVLSDNGSCLEWTGSLTKGYGRIRVGGRLFLVHRIVLQAEQSAYVDHMCANRSCCNPRHLRQVTLSENNRHRTGLSRNNTSGYPGVSWDRKAQAWRAQASKDARVLRIGQADTAYAAYLIWADWQRRNNSFVRSDLLTLPNRD